MRRTTFYVTIIAVVIGISGFVREIIFSYFFGVSDIADAHILALTIPGVIFEFIGAAIVVAYIPTYSRIENDSGRKKADEYTNNLINMLMIVIFIIYIIGLIFSNAIVHFIATGFDDTTIRLAVAFTRISLGGMFFNILIAIFKSYLQLKSNFIIPALASFPMHIVIIISIIISSGGNIYILSVGAVISMATRFIFLLPALRKSGYNHKFLLDLKDENIKQMLILASPIVIGVSVNQINTLVDRSIASSIIVGGISALNYSKLILVFVRSIFVLSIITVTYPILSKLAVENKIDNLRNMTIQNINIANLLTVPIVVGIIFFSEPIIRFLFGRGAFDEYAIAMTHMTLLYLSIGMIGMGVRDIVAKVFYSLQDTKTPLINSAVGLSLNIILNIFLSRFMGINGLALATSIGATTTGLLLLMSLRRKIGQLKLLKVFASLGKMMSASLIMGVIAKLSYNYFISNAFAQGLSLILSIIIGIIIYFITVVFMKIEEVDTIISLMKNRINNYKSP